MQHRTKSGGKGNDFKQVKKAVKELAEGQAKIKDLGGLKVTERSAHFTEEDFKEAARTGMQSLRKQHGQGWFRKPRISRVITYMMGW
jgi:hypothetical protein